MFRTTIVLGIEKTPPPPFGKNSQKFPFLFWVASLIIIITIFVIIDSLMYTNMTKFNFESEFDQVEEPIVKAMVQIVHLA